MQLEILQRERMQIIIFQILWTDTDKKWLRFIPISNLPFSTSTILDRGA